MKLPKRLIIWEVRLRNLNNGRNHWNLTAFKSLSRPPDMANPMLRQRHDLCWRRGFSHQPNCPGGAVCSAPSGAQGFVLVHIAYKDTAPPARKGGKGFPFFYKYPAPLARMIARYAFCITIPILRRGEVHIPHPVLYNHNVYLEKKICQLGKNLSWCSLFSNSPAGARFCDGQMPLPSP